ncbi:hypothetical protein P885DRAFT_64761 [Corynascus similis CBS 632.67]
MSRYYRNPLSEHMVTHDHDLQSGCMNEPAGGETAEQRNRDKPKQPADEALRPSHVLGGEKNAPPPTASGSASGTSSDLGRADQALTGMGPSRTQEGLRRSGKASEGVGGLEGRPSKMGG